MIYTKNGDMRRDDVFPMVDFDAKSSERLTLPGVAGRLRLN